MVVLVICIKMKIHSKMKALERSQHVSHFKSIGCFPDAQGQLTLVSGARSGRNSKSFKLLWLSLLPARTKKIHSKMKALERSRHVSHFKSIGSFPDAQGQLTLVSEVRPGRNSNSSKLLWQSWLPARMKKIQ